MERQSCRLPLCASLTELHEFIFSLQRFRNCCSSKFMSAREACGADQTYFIDILNLANPERGRGSAATEGESKDPEDLSYLLPL